jgi:hypothetical protein
LREFDCQDSETELKQRAAKTQFAISRVTAAGPARVPSLSWHHSSRSLTFDRPLGDQHAFEQCLDVAAVYHLDRREGFNALDQIQTARENGDTIPALLAVPDRAVALG